MQIFATVPSFDQPIDMLEACHRNILKRMDTLGDLAGALRTDGIAALREHAEIWREVIAFITHNVAHHTLDEEELLFPMLREHRLEGLERLEAEHDDGEALETSIMTAFESLMEVDDETQRVRLADDATRLVTFYRSHIERENTSILPEARRLLSPEQIALMGTAMRARRGIDAGT